MRINADYFTYIVVFYTQRKKKRKKRKIPKDMKRQCKNWHRQENEKKKKSWKRKPNSFHQILNLESYWKAIIEFQNIIFSICICWTCSSALDDSNRLRSLLWFSWLDQNSAPSLFTQNVVRESSIHVVHAFYYDKMCGVPLLAWHLTLISFIVLLICLCICFFSSYVREIGLVIDLETILLIKDVCKFYRVVMNYVLLPKSIHFPLFCCFSWFFFP